MANRTFEVARKMFSFALARDLIEASPFQGVSKPSAEHQRERVLSEDEIRAVWKAIQAEPITLAATLKLRLLTGQRGGEVFAMRWADLDLKSGWWVIPGEFTKNGHEHRVPLSAPVIGIITELEKLRQDPIWVFPGNRSSNVTYLWRLADRVRKASGVDFVPHDLRRTAASQMAAIGIGRLIISKILNHTDPSVTAVYDRHSYDAEKRRALDVWAERMTAIVEGVPTGSNVVSIR
jgi:integrase